MLLIGKLGDKNFWYHAKQFSTLGTGVDILRIGKSLELKGVSFNRVKYKSRFFTGVVSLALMMRSHETIVCFGFRWIGLIASIINLIYGRKIIIVCVGTDVYTLRKVGFLVKRLPINLFVFPGNVNLQRSGLKDKVESYFLPWIFPENMTRGDFKKGGNWLMVTRFDKNKNIEYGIQLFLRSCLDSNTTLSLYGDGPEFQYFKSKYSDEERIQFKGFLDSDLIEYERYTYFLQTSYSEGLSLALIEAVWKGLLPFVTKAGDEEAFLGDDYKGYLSGDLIKDSKLLVKLIAMDEQEVKKSIVELILKYKDYEYRQREGLRKLL